MKKLLPLVVVLFLSAGIKAQRVTIPDQFMVSYLKNAFPTCITGDQLDTTCPAIVNAKKVDCTFWYIGNYSGIEYFDNLDTLLCYQNLSEVIPALPPKLRYLSASANYFTTLPPLPSTLTYLDCSNNNIQSLPELPQSLVHLLTFMDSLKSLPALPSSLKELNCGYNPDLGSLPALPASLTHLSCYSTVITTLPALSHTSLIDLYVSSNPITSIPALPATLESISCSENNLTALPQLPAKLNFLGCSYNLLTSLPALPAGLKTIDCSVNQITALPQLPPALRYLKCSNNKITTLPAMPDTLGYLEVANNKVGTLPFLGDSVLQLIANNCELTALTNVPPNLRALYLYDNPALNCLPPFKSFYSGSQGSVHLLKTGIKCLANAVQHPGSILALDTLPICTPLFNPNGCETSWSIKGSIFSDINGDCKRQGTEGAMQAPVKINLYQSGNLVQSGCFVGNYSFNTSPGTYRIQLDTVGLPVNPTCYIDRTIVLGVDSLQSDINFGVDCRPGADMGVKSIYGNLFRPATRTTINTVAGDLAKLYGMQCSGRVGGTVILSINGPAKYVSPAQGAFTPQSTSNKRVEWSVYNFRAFDPTTAFNIVVATDTFAQAGQQVCITMIVVPDDNSGNDTLTECFAVRTSFDPNDKQVSPIGDIYNSTKWLTYTVRFQNTGNDTAIHIYVMDTLDTHVQASTFELLTYSHKPTVQLYEPGIVRFNFPNIMLPDSNVNEKASHGYIQYRVKPKANLPIGTDITNTAYIYFDFNPPVVTNTTTSKMSVDIPTGISKQQENSNTVNLFPNPANNVLYTTTTGFVPQWITVYDLNGKKLSEQPYTQQLDIANLQAGMYLLEVRSGVAVARNRFVKM